ncbi:MAG: hypothetical protein ACI4IJ_07370 [Acutalibacteraceae bacterium]
MNEIKKMLTWFRNSAAFIYAWLTLLLVIWANISGMKSLPTVLLGDLFIFSALAAAGFSAIFTKALIKKMGFVGRLNCMMIYFICIEIGFFYKIGLFVTQGSLIEWLVFFVIIIVLYAICLVIFGIYSRRKEREYTGLLTKYKMIREKCKDE